MPDPGSAPGEKFVLEVDGLAVSFPTEHGWIKVVDDVGFTVRQGRTVSVVGESGSGKSVTSLAIMGLLKFAGAGVTARSLKLRDRGGDVIDLLGVPANRLRQLRGDEMAMIFQEPMTSLNPSHTVGRQIAEVLRIHRGSNVREARAAAIAMLERVGMSDPARQADAYPHEMSGGMRQRAMIAIALACNPGLMIADEPTTALDVTIQAQIMEELRKLQNELGMAMLFVTHDFGLVAEIAHDVAVMYAGQVIEQGSVLEVLKRPRHPYTRGMLDAVPRADRDREARLRGIPGRVPEVFDMPIGCRFHPRCRHAQAGRCDVTPPQLENIDDRHAVRCLRWRELDLAS